MIASVIKPGTQFVQFLGSNQSSLYSPVQVVLGCGPWEVAVKSPEAAPHPNGSLVMKPKVTEPTNIPGMPAVTVSGCVVMPEYRIYPPAGVD